MATIKRFDDFQIWQISRQLAMKVKRLTETKLFSKDFRFLYQINASARSVMDKIVEGFERSGRWEFVNFLSTSKGSAGEVRSQRYRSVDYGYLKEGAVLKLINQYGSLASKISGFIECRNKSIHKGQKFKERT